MKILLIGYGAMNERVARLAEENNNEIVGVVVKDQLNNTPTLLLIQFHQHLKRM